MAVYLPLAAFDSIRGTTRFSTTDKSRLLARIIIGAAAEDSIRADSAARSSTDIHSELAPQIVRFFQQILR